MTLLHRTSIHSNKSLTILKMTFYEIAQAQFLSVKFDNVVSTFFVNHLDQKLSLIQNLLGLWHSYIEPQYPLNKSLTILKMTFYEIAQAQFLSVKFDNVVSTFFVNHLDQKLSLIQNLLGLWHSYKEPQFIWTSPWPYWKWLFMKLRKHSFWAWNLTT